jgi:capsular polysaccharide biosynthesis protein
VLDWAPVQSGANRALERVFLARRQNSDRDFNSAEVEAWARADGFHAVYPEEFSFAQQVALFRSATHIIGPTGAAFSNVLFGSSELRALRLHGGAQPYDNFFANLASVSGCAVFDLSCSATSGGSFLVEEQSFRNAVRLLLASAPRGNDREP